MPSATSTNSEARLFRRTPAFGISLGLALGMSFSLCQAQAAEAMGPRWYQVEMTVFTHENSNLELELWSPERLSLAFPQRLRKLLPVSDVLQLDDWSVLSGERIVEESVAPPVAIVGPLPYAPAAPGEGFSIPDLLREPFWELPSADHDFVSTNRALTQSAQHRILFHAAWRQPMTRLNAATPVAIIGGRAFADRHELEGSLRLFFNNSEDRVMMEPNLWFSTFANSPAANTSQEGPVWQLPPLPEILQTPADNSAAAGSNQPLYVPTRVIQVNQSREARSNEFHYIDHPAIGVFIQLTPYEVPPLVEAAEPTQLPAMVAPPLELQ